MKVIRPSGYPVYEDQPRRGLGIRLVLILPPAVLIGGSMYAMFTGDEPTARALFIEGVVIVLLFWSVLPRKYQVYRESVKIVMGGPFAININFDSIKLVKVAAGPFLGLSLAGTFTREHVEIHRRRGPNIAITPRDPDRFVVNLKKAIENWRRTGI